MLWTRKKLKSMSRRSILISLAGIAFPLIQAISCPAQSGKRAPEASAPFGTTTSGYRTPIIFRAADAMSSVDRRAVSDRWPSISKKGAMDGFDLSEQKWTYQQIVCPVFTEHLLLLFSRNGGPGDRSALSAVLPRKSGEPVRIVPLLRRSYAPYTAAPENPVTLSVFNQTLASERMPKEQDWLSVALCYAALSGAHVVPYSPTVEIGTDGGSVVRFIDIATPQRPQAWKLIFDKMGHLAKAAVERAQVPIVKVVP